MKDYSAKFRLDGRVALVAGAAGLIGREVCKLLAAGGADVWMLDVDRLRGNALEKEIRLSGFMATFRYFDITQLKSLETSLKKIVKSCGRIDVWVNSAYPRTKNWVTDVENLKLESLRKNVDLHFNSCLWASRAVSLLMKKQKRSGSIINFGSIYGVQGNDFSVYEGTDLKSPLAYAAIKGGIINATRYLASYFGKYNIRVNTVCPGGVFDNQNKKFVQNYERKVPLKRMACAEEIAASVLFLASEASSYVTGSTLMVDGGWTIV